MYMPDVYDSVDLHIPHNYDPSLTHSLTYTLTERDYRDQEGVCTIHQVRVTLTLT